MAEEFAHEPRCQKGRIRGGDEGCAAAHLLESFTNAGQGAELGRPVSYASGRHGRDFLVRGGHHQDLIDAFAESFHHMAQEGFAAPGKPRFVAAHA